MRSSRFANDCSSLAGIYNVDTKCVHHCLHQEGDLPQDIEIIDRTKRGNLHRHLATNALSSGCECSCLMEKKQR